MPKWLPIVLIVGAVYFLNIGGVQDMFKGAGAGGATTTTTTTTSTNVNIDDADLNKYISPTITFSGKNHFTPGTSITTEFARVFSNGNDLKYTSLNSGQKEAPAGVPTTVYCGENSSTYYTGKAVFTLDQETIPYTCSLCTIDTAPSFTNYNDDDQPTTRQAISADQTKTVSYKIVVAADKCYGNQQSDCSSNAVCYKYNSTCFSYVKDASLAPLGSVPTGISNSYSGAGFNIVCYKMPKITDNGEYRGKVEMKALLNPDGNDDIMVYSKDCDMDLNADDLTEIWGFQDEDNNVIGATAVALGNFSVS